MNLDQQIIQKFKQSPLYFIATVWKLTPQKVKPQRKGEVDIFIANGLFDKITVDDFEPFVKGKNITWQQWLILLSVERALVYGKNKISIVSGHGIGKSATLSWLIIWYLFCHLDAQVGATAPSSEQLHDVLWKEASLWMGKMPKELADLFEWQTGYIRVKERQDTWFARARTARKESPEAIAGLHGDYVMIIADEASGIADEIYRSAAGSLTGPNTLVLLISNGTRNEGYFYETHHEDRGNWQTFSFSSEDSPIVGRDFFEQMEAKYGMESDEYKIRVQGRFPSSEQMDEKGWIPLLVTEQVVLGPDNVKFVGRKVMGVDPSGEGDDTTRWVIRDNYQSQVVKSQASSNEKEIAMLTLDLMREFELDSQDVYIDNFGVGANVAKEILLLDHQANVQGTDWGDTADDEDLYLNKRAECCFRAREWIIRGGAVVGDELKRDILAYPYRNTITGKKQILEKVKIKKRLGRSPDRGDAFFMTFLGDTDLRESSRVGKVIISQGEPVDKYSSI